MSLIFFTGCDRAGQEGRKAPPSHSATSQNAPYSVRWTYAAGSPVPSPAAFQDGVAYLADETGTMHALALSNGRLLWKRKVGEGVKAAPSTVGGMIFLGDLKGKMHAIADDDGHEMWTADLGSPIPARALLQGDALACNTDSGSIIALSAPDGRRLWSVTTGDGLRGGLASSGRLVLAAGCDMKLHGVDPVGGIEQLSFDLGEQSGGTPATMGNTVFVGSFRGTLRCISLPEPKVLWTFESPQEVGSTYASPVPAENGVVLYAPGNTLFAIDSSTGKVLWSVEAAMEMAAEPVAAHGRAYYASGGRLFSVDLATGRALWQFDAGGTLSAVSADEDCVIAADSAGKIYCLEIR